MTETRDGSTELRERIQSEFFNDGAELSKVYNAALQTLRDFLSHRRPEGIQPIKHYADYLREHYPKEADIIIALSSSHDVKESDRTIASINRFVERLKTEGRVRMFRDLDQRTFTNVLAVLRRFSMEMKCSTEPAPPAGPPVLDIEEPI